MDAYETCINKNFIRVMGCGCLSIVGAMTTIGIPVTGVSKNIHQIIQEVPGGYISVIGSPVISFIIIRSMMRKFKKNTQRNEFSPKNQGKVIDIQVEIIKK